MGSERETADGVARAAPHADDTAGLSDRLRWTFEWQTRNLVPLLAAPEATERLRSFWNEARHMDRVLARVALGREALSVDVGGGMTSPLRWLPGRRICVDPLSDHYASASHRRHSDVEFVTGQGERLPIASGTADLVICTNCIDHVDDPARVVREILRVLKPDGWVWFSCEIRPPEVARNAGHPHGFDRAAILALVSQFQIVLKWEEPWRGIYRYLRDLNAEAAETELGFLLQNGSEHSDGA